MNTVRSYIALNSNLNNPIQQMNRALQALKHLPESKLQQVSRFYQNPPMGPQDQPDFINAVAALDTSLEPFALLTYLQQIENQQGRVRDPKRPWGERTLDLDILLYGDCCIQSEHLTIPHAGLMQRYFFLLPLYEIAPELKLPNGELLSACLPLERAALLTPVNCGV